MDKLTDLYCLRRDGGELKGFSDDLPDLMFNKNDLDKITILINDYLLTQMQAYSCKGCNKCWYANKLYENEWCERKFKKFEELYDYLHMLDNSETCPYIGIYKVKFKPHDKVGFVIIEDLIWSLNCSYLGEINL
jgi:hypothetical protein